MENNSILYILLTREPLITFEKNVGVFEKTMEIKDIKPNYFNQLSTNNLLPNVMIKFEASENKCFEGICINEHSHVTQGARSNLIIIEFVSEMESPILTYP